MKILSLDQFKKIVDRFIDKNEPDKKTPLVVCLDNEDYSFKVIDDKPYIEKVYAYKEEIKQNRITTLFNEKDLTKLPSLESRVEEISLLNFKVYDK